MVSIYIPSAAEQAYWQSVHDRMELETLVQSLVGPIVGISALSRAELYGIRDAAIRRHWRR